MKNLKKEIEELGLNLEKCGEELIGIKNEKGKWISFVDTNNNEYYFIVASFNELNQKAQNILTNILENYIKIIKNQEVNK